MMSSESKILISIIIPVYNQLNYRLKRCLDSVEKQSYKNYEVIIVDDGSKLELNEKYKALSDAYPKVKMITQDNRGCGAARNSGILLAKGEYCLFLDSDDILSEDCLKDAVECLNISNADLVVGQLQKNREEEFRLTSNLISNSSKIFIDKKIDIIKYMNHILGYENSLFRIKNRYFCDGPVGKLCKTELLKNTLFDGENFWSEDTIWNIKFTKKCSSIVVSDAIWYYVLSNEDSQTHIFRKSCESEFKFRIKQEYDLIQSMWPECKDGLCVQVWLSTYYLFQCFIMHKKNKNGWISNYKVFKRCVTEETYKWMLKNIKFDYCANKYKILIKKIMCFLCSHEPKFISYIAWRLILHSKNGER